MRVSLGSPPRRICFFLCPNVMGGVEVNAFTLGKFLDSARYNVSFIFPWPNASLQRSAPGPIKIFPLKHWQDFKALAHWLQKNRIELLHNFGYFDSGAVAAYLAKIPIVWEIAGFRSSYSLSQEKDGILQKMAFLNPSVVVPSRDLQTNLHYLRDRHVERIPYGVDVDRLSTAMKTKGSPFQRILRLSPENKVVAMVGNFYPGKRHLDFLRAGALLCRRDPRIRLVIAGRCFQAPPGLRRSTQMYLKSVLRSAQSLGLEKRLRIISFTETSRVSFLQTIDVLLSPSVEGFGLAMAEAMAMDKPVISVDQGGGRDLIQNRISGRLVPFGQPKRMADAALELLRDGHLASSLGRAASLRIRRHFTAVLQAKRHQALYERILKGPSTSPFHTTP